MKRYLVILSGLIAGFLPSAVWAEEHGGYSRGNAMMYYSLIAFVLIYGLHDTFHTKWLTWGAVIVIPVVFYMMLPAQ